MDHEQVSTSTQTEKYRTSTPQTNHLIEIYFQQLKDERRLVVLHHQDIHHGSGASTRLERALVAHYMRGYVTFRQEKLWSSWMCYLHLWRYKSVESEIELDETFFPVFFGHKRTHSRYDITIKNHGYITVKPRWLNFRAEYITDCLGSDRTACLFRLVNHVSMQQPESEMDTIYLKGLVQLSWLEKP